jgi:subtilisin-like proprotein convertase family protein
LISSLTVNINITHPDPLSELKMYLIGPNGNGGPRVQMFNFSGDNAVADFNDTSSFGPWTLEVYDTVNKKKGKLNSWSITIGN